MHFKSWLCTCYQALKTWHVYRILQGAFLLLKEKTTSLHDKNDDKYVYMNSQLLVYLKVEQQINTIIFLKHAI